MNQTEIINIIIQTINTIFNNFFASIDNSIYNSLDTLFFINSSLLEDSIFTKLLGSNGKYSLIYLSDAMILGVCLFYLVRYYYMNIIDVTVEKPSHFFFKLLIFSLLINFSYFILQQLLDIFFYISSSVQEIGQSISNCSISFSELVTFLNKNLITSSDEFNIFSFDGIIKSFISVGLINLLLSYSLRYVIIQILVLFSPCAFLSLINESSSWIFKSWARSVFSLLILQLFIPLIIIIVLCIDQENKVLLVGGIYALTSINQYIQQMFGGIGIEVSTNVNSFLYSLKK